MRLSFLFNPIFRVWNFRLLLLGTLSLIVVEATQLQYDADGGHVLLGGLSLMFIHHILAVLEWSFRGLASLELGLHVLESLGLVAYILHYSDLTPVIIAPELALSAVFRLVTILESSPKLFRQRLAFLGGCMPAYPPYTPTRILLNRSIARPLVRSESRPILFVRAVVIVCIGLGVPLFAFYYVVFLPVQTQIYSRYVSPFQFFGAPPGYDFTPPGNASLLVQLYGSNSHASDLATFIQMKIQFAVDSDVNVSVQEVSCQTFSVMSNGGNLIQCPHQWVNVLNMTISVSLPPGTTGVYVVPVQGALPGPNNRDILADWLADFQNTLNFALLFGGSRLAGTFSWTKTNMIGSRGWDLLSPPTLTVYTSEIHGLQPYPAEGTSDPSTITLTLVQSQTLLVKKLFIDTADATVLNGVSTFGGFWTFLNGAFALFFGANILYFAFGRRPLSALGLVHIFQRRRLKRQWIEDFPAIHTEGGLPGSESAGIVAFIRERLVDLGEDPHEHLADQPDDVEAQKISEVEDTDSLDNVPVTKFQTRAHSEFDEIPLLDVNVGFTRDKMLHTKNPV
ncbi:hypothetical protein B0H16DRAFT_1687645 [Mycena metata]|uniref:Uncharacterized protein n=1 Tax=Mycena metata TaxID=1033252 RepID=A0AAD7NKK5_9AGAR|nr:hypothetical protein B0H16DRAFT_1687645 [Mycena metata]